MKKFLTLIVAGILTGLPAFTQSLVDGFSQGKGKLSLVLSYNRESYDEFYLGDAKTDLSATGLEKIIKQSVSLYGSYGLADNVDIIVNIPYISSMSDMVMSSESVSENSIQNGSLFVEWRALKSEGSGGTFSATGALGVSVPLSDYTTNVIFAIGNRAVSLDPKIVLQYGLNSGAFANVQGGYSIRSNDVPEAVSFSAKIGFAGSGFYVDGWFDQQWSTGGIDIGEPGFTPERFPETTVNTTRIGASAYASITQPFGITVGGGTTLAGRNARLPGWSTVGVVLQFGGE